MPRAIVLCDIILDTITKWHCDLCSYIKKMEMSSGNYQMLQNQWVDGWNNYTDLVNLGRLCHCGWWLLRCTSPQSKIIRHGKMAMFNCHGHVEWPPEGIRINCSGQDVRIDMALLNLGRLRALRYERNLFNAATRPVDGQLPGSRSTRENRGPAVNLPDSTCLDVSFHSFPSGSWLKLCETLWNAGKPPWRPWGASWKSVPPAVSLRVNGLWS